MKKIFASIIIGGMLFAGLSAPADAISITTVTNSSTSVNGGPSVRIYKGKNCTKKIKSLARGKSYSGNVGSVKVSSDFRLRPSGKKSKFYAGGKCAKVYTGIATKVVVLDWDI